MLDRSIELFCDNLRRFATASRCSTSSTRRPATDATMQIAIVGLAGSGKTTVFNTLTRGQAETGGFGGVTVNVGVVKVPDERLDRLTELFKPKRGRPADVTYVDLPAPPASTEGRVGPRSSRPTSSRGCATPMRCSTSSARSRIRAHPHPAGASTPRATSSSSTSSSRSPTSR